MIVLALLSGGKDSIYALLHAIANGHQIIALGTLLPAEGIDELDSYMYQSIGTRVFLPLIAECLGIPLYTWEIKGKGVDVGAEFGSREGIASKSIPSGIQSDTLKTESEQDETSDLTSLISLVLSHHPEINALSTGAILSTYQRIRIEYIASHIPSSSSSSSSGMGFRPPLTCLSYLWQRPEGSLVDEMIQAGMEVILVKVAGMGLVADDVGRTLGQMRRKLGILEMKYGCHVAGEGGEFETITLDCPLYSSRIEILNSSVTITDPSPVAHLTIPSPLTTSIRLLPKANHINPTPLELRRLLKSDEKGVEGMSLLDEESENLMRGLEEWEASIHERLVANKGDESEQRIGAERLRLEKAEEDREIVTSEEDGPHLGRIGNWFCVSVEGRTVEGEGIEDEMRRCFEAVQACLKSNNLSLLHIQHQNLLLSDMSTFPLANKSYSTFFGTSPPSRACVSVPLPPHQRLRLEAYGYDDSSIDPKHREFRSALHVQSISYWAPANIGPYSQSVTIANRVSIAGQIGLIPCDLTFPLPRSFRMEAVLGLQHVRRICGALKGKEAIGGGWEGDGWVEGVIGWYVDKKDEGEMREIWKRHREAESLPSNIPILFVQALALPKGALVEWQFAMHTGRLPSTSDLLQDDPDAVASVSHSMNGQEGAVQSCKSMDAGTSFSIRTCKDIQDPIPPSNCLSRAFSIRIFHDSTLPQTKILRAKERLRGSLPAAVSLIPCLSLSTVTQSSVPVAYVIMGT